jgi:hypothetical protein
LIGRSPWRPTIARDAGGRWSVAASPRPGDVDVKPSGCSGHPPVTNVACNCVPAVRTGGSRNPSTVERWGCGERAVGAAGCVAFGSGSMCRWRRSAVVRIPAFPGWRSRWSKRCDTRSERHSQRSERRNASSAEAAGAASAANVASSMVPNDSGGSNCRGVVSSRARWGATACVDPGLPVQGGGSR